MATGSRLLSVLSSILLFTLVASWDTDDFEIFDLMEEVNENFYTMLNVDPGATNKEIRRAYRRLAIQYHPDKNDETDMEKKFIQLAAMYEILKDDEKRKRYDRVLVEGLPDWRQPVFYYRRVRKMGILEMTGLLAVILTIGQYLVGWAVYFEKRLSVEDFYETKKKRAAEKNRKKSKIGVEEIEEEIEEELKSLPKPRLLDLWMFRFPGFVMYLGRRTPELVEFIKEFVVSRMRKEEQDDEMDGIDDVKVARKVKREKKKAEIPEYQPELYENVLSTHRRNELLKITEEEEEKEVKQKNTGEWNEEELILLAKAVNKFPGGCVNRWEKIADYVGRSVEEVTLKSKEIKGRTYNMNLSSSVQGGSFSAKSKKRDWDISDAIITTTEEMGEVNNTEEDNKLRRRNKPLKPSKTSDRTLLIVEDNPESVIQTESVAAGASQSTTNLPRSQPEAKGACSSESSKVKVDSDTWTQNQQVIFEWALKHIPKTVDKRWDKIAEQIPGKTKEDCIQRFKYLAEMVKKKKEGQM